MTNVISGLQLDSVRIATSLDQDASALQGGHSGSFFLDDG